MIQLKEHQIDALHRLRSGSILCGGTGSGKSLTAIAWFYICNGGILGKNNLTNNDVKKLFIITTAKKRDSLEWNKELENFSLYNDSEKVFVDSWNNIKRYADVQGAYFIFDEQRVVGYGAWSKTFIKIARKNKWILLTATPGDTWQDYAPVMIANNYYRNITDWRDQHVIWQRFSRIPKIDHYICTKKLSRILNDILVVMKDDRTIEHEVIHMVHEYNEELYLSVKLTRWNYFKEQPIVNAGEYCYVLREVVNKNFFKILEIKKVLEQHKKVIIFYNFNYELEDLRELFNTLDYPYSEWNGDKHEEILKDHDKWVYLVQYTAGSEGWNCIETDTIIFYSLNYSYKVMKQAAGRTDRLNTPYKKLFYYILYTKTPIDKAILLALKTKKKFNENKFVEEESNEKKSRTTCKTQEDSLYRDW